MDICGSRPPAYRNRGLRARRSASQSYEQQRRYRRVEISLEAFLRHRRPPFSPVRATNLRLEPIIKKDLAARRPDRIASATPGWQKVDQPNGLS